MKTKTENVKDLRDHLIDCYDKLRVGQIGQSQAKEESNVAGKILSSAKIQMEYNKMTGKKDKSVKFLESDE